MFSKQRATYLLYFIGLLCFLYGFFLTRRELGHKANRLNDLSITESLLQSFHSHDDTVGHIANHYLNNNNRGKGWKRVFIFLIDALRLDFVISPEHSESTSNFPFLTQLLNENRSQTFLYGFRADPPTVTAQRLKSLLTGSLPTFLDVGSNLNSAALHDDNLIHQLAEHLVDDEEIIVMGDDTWQKLFPSIIKNDYMFESFNTHDLDTVDFGILAQWEELFDQRNWRLFVTHFLGVDHIGHSYHAFHHFMRDRLHLMDSILKKVVEKLPDDALLFVFGDHGMTDDGEHGGASLEETNSVLFAYSRHPFVQNDLPQVTEVVQNNVIVMPQIDLVPSLAFVLDLPIPFSSLGKVFPALYPDRSLKNISLLSVNDQEDIVVVVPCDLLDALSRNARQVWRYVAAYFSLSDIDPLITRLNNNSSSSDGMLNWLEMSSGVLKKRTESLNANNYWDQAQLDLLHILSDHLKLIYEINTVNHKNEGLGRAQEELIKRYSQWLEQIQYETRRLWTTFQPLPAISGLVLMSFSLIYLMSTQWAEMRSFFNRVEVISLVFPCVAVFSNSFVQEEKLWTFFLFQLTILVLCFKEHFYVCMLSTISLRLAQSVTVRSFLSTRPILSLALHPLLFVLIFDQLQQANGKNKKKGNILSNFRDTMGICVAHFSVVLLHFNRSLALPSTQWEAWLVVMTICGLALQWLFCKQLSWRHLLLISWHVYAGLALFINTFASEVLVMLMLHPDASMTGLDLLLARMIVTTFSAFAAWILRRHLMLWAIFAPKLVFEVCSLLVCAGTSSLRKLPLVR
eukprot:scaffold2798_cov160-Ochromonas_danica.AAC.28